MWLGNQNHLNVILLKSCDDLSKILLSDGRLHTSQHIITAHAKQHQIRLGIHHHIQSVRHILFGVAIDTHVVNLPACFLSRHIRVRPTLIRPITKG